MNKKSNLSALISTTRSQRSTEKNKLGDEGFRKRLEYATTALTELPKSIDPPVLKKTTEIIRDTFSFPDCDYALIDQIRNRSPALQRRITKSEVLRTGLHILSSLTDQELVSALARIKRIKAGRKGGT